MSDVEFFNSAAPGWDAGNTLSTPEKIDSVLTMAAVGEGDSVLDIGSGTGVLLPALLNRTGSRGRVVSLDFSQQMQQIARGKHAGDPRVEFRLANVETSEVEGRFDRIMLYCVFPHLHSPAATLRRLYADNLRPGGTITIAHPTGRDAINSIHRRCPIHSHGLPPATELAALMRTAGIAADRITDTPALFLVRATKPPQKSAEMSRK